MSAFVVNKKDIDYIISAALYHGALPKNHGDFRYFYNGSWYAVTPDNANITGFMLWEENTRSVNYRYSDGDLPTDFILERNYSPNIVTAFKIISCYCYQSCETPDWEKSKAFAMIQYLKDSLITDLPGYEDAPWGF